jgi:hypothetical protein
MEFQELLGATAQEPLFESGLLLVGDTVAADVYRQLSRWTRSGRLFQLRRGLYSLAPPYRKVEPHPFLVANRLVHGSYVSCQSALAFFGLIPEGPQAVTSVAAARPQVLDTPLGRHEIRHLRPGLIWGYRRLEVAPGQEALVATPEKALLDLLYLEPGGDSLTYLRELRLQNLESLDLGALDRAAAGFGKPKLRRAAERVRAMAEAEGREWVTL